MQEVLQGIEAAAGHPLSSLNIQLSSTREARAKADVRLEADVIGVQYGSGVMMHPTKRLVFSIFLCGCKQPKSIHIQMSGAKVANPADPRKLFAIFFLKTESSHARTLLYHT